MFVWVISPQITGSCLSAGNCWSSSGSVKRGCLAATAVKDDSNDRFHDLWLSTDGETEFETWGFGDLQTDEKESFKKLLTIVISLADVEILIFQIKSFVDQMKCKLNFIIIRMKCSNLSPTSFSPNFSNAYIESNEHRSQVPESRISIYAQALPISLRKCFLTLLFCWYLNVGFESVTFSKAITYRKIPTLNRH